VTETFKIQHLTILTRRLLHCVALCCSVLQCGSVYCSVLQCVGLGQLYLSAALEM